MSSVANGGKRRVTDDIINRIGGGPFHKAVDRLCAAVIRLLPNIPTENAAELGAALGDLQEASLSQTTSTAAATIVAAVSGFDKRLSAHEQRCEERHKEVMEALANHLKSHEAGR